MRIKFKCFIITIIFLYFICVIIIYLNTISLLNKFNNIFSYYLIYLKLFLI